MVSYDVDGIGGSFKLESSVLEYSYNNQQLLIVNLVVTFSGRIFPGEVRDRSKNAVVVVLRQNSYRYIVEGIYFNNDALLGVVVSEDDIEYKRSSKGIERLLVYWDLFLRSILLS